MRASIIGVWNADRSTAREKVASTWSKPFFSIVQSLIGKLQEIIHKERERRKQEEERKRKRLQEIEKELKDLQEQVTQQRNSPMDKDIAENEILALQEKIREREAEKKGLEK